MRVAVAVVLLFLCAGDLLGCPVCDTETGRQVREGIFGPDFFSNALLTLAPFPVVLALIALLFRVLPDGKKVEAAGGPLE